MMEPVNMIWICDTYLQPGSDSRLPSHSVLAYALTPMTYGSVRLGAVPGWAR
jgi:hypothetical protein